MSSLARTLLSVTALLSTSACATVQVTPQEPSAETAQAFSKRIPPLAAVNVPANTRLISARVDGKQAYCTTFAAYHVVGDSRHVCFFDSKHSGVFDKLYILGTLNSITYDSDLPYTLSNAPAGPPPLTHGQLAAAADFAECDYQAHAATVGMHGIILPAAEYAQLRHDCLKARQLRKMEQQAAD